VDIFSILFSDFQNLAVSRHKIHRHVQQRMATFHSQKKEWRTIFQRCTNFKNLQKGSYTMQMSSKLPHPIDSALEVLRNRAL